MAPHFNLRHWTAVAIAAIATVAVVQLGDAAKSGGSNTTKTKPLIVSGSVEGLYPGGTSILQVVVTNENNTAIEVTSVVVSASDAGPSCPASVLTFEPLALGQVIRAGSTAEVPVAVSMSVDAVDACQGQAFPVRHTVTARRAK